MAKKNGAVLKKRSLEEVTRHELSHFFERIGSHQVTGLHRTVMEQVERPLIEEALRWSAGNQLRAAEALGINRNTLRRKMRAFGIGS